MDECVHECLLDCSLAVAMPLNSAVGGLFPRLGRVALDECLGLAEQGEQAALVLRRVREVVLVLAGEARAEHA